MANIFEQDDLFSVFDEDKGSSSNSAKKRKEVNLDDSIDLERPPVNITSRGTHVAAPLPQVYKKARQMDIPVNQPVIQDLISSKMNEDSNNHKELEIKHEEGGDIVSCLHEVCLPPDTENKKHTFDSEIYHPKYPPARPLARTWPFNLDPFQKKSVACIERNESVLVSAHTSAGKTVVAEYAIAMSLKANQRVVYTSPIKALSNQKYREFYEIFSDVGLMTGDITINPTASCLVMTTEILRSMLYRGSEILREVAWVIFDEIHYMRDRERGVVWEETIILLPDTVHYVFLSATIPNAREFASWIAKIHDQPCHVVYTDFRPTPLQHYIFPAGGDGLHLVVDEKGVFREENFQKALSQLAVSAQTTPQQRKQKGKQTKGGSDIYKIVKMIMERKYEPVIVFSFSKRECEALALQMAKLDLSNDEEKKLIEKVFSNAIDSLSDDDKKLPQVGSILPLLKRGVGIHHSGLLPLLKEVIEILFQEGLIKALFATETFSIGLNMPAKTVVFTSVRKFDGENFRWVTSGEYIQMSGRAGRRGLDDRGIVILMVDEKMEPEVAKNMVKGSADALYSSFYISYNMLLNLLRVEGIDPEYMLKRSFHQFQTDKLIPRSELKVKELEDAKAAIKIKNEDELEDYHNLQEQLHILKLGVKEVVIQPIHALPFLQPGRLVKVKDGSKDWGWGVVVNFQKVQEKGQPQSVNVDNANAKYIVDVLLHCVIENGKPEPLGSNDSNATVQFVPVAFNLIDSISSARIYVPKDLRPLENRLSVGKSVKEVQKRFPDGVPLLDPLEDMKIEDSDFKKLIRKLELVEDKISSNPAFKAPDLLERYELYRKKLEIDSEIKAIRKFVKQNEDVILKHELKCMKRVLRRLGYTTAEDIVETKGRVACEINAGDELLITELMFGGFFNDLTPEQSAAVLSSLIFEEKSENNPKLKEELAAPFRQMQDYARKIAKVSTECKLKLDVEEYVQRLNPIMIDVVYAWATGAKFAQICTMTEIFEGSIIRAIRRLEELMRQLSVAAKSIGNTELENKFADGISKIKRDIVFAASLYL